MGMGCVIGTGLVCSQEQRHLTRWFQEDIGGNQEFVIRSLARRLHRSLHRGRIVASSPMQIQRESSSAAAAVMMVVRGLGCGCVVTHKQNAFEHHRSDVFC
jgi:hypothetical protein